MVNPDDVTPADLRSDTVRCSICGAAFKRYECTVEYEDKRTPRGFVDVPYYETPAHHGPEDEAGAEHQGEGEEE